MRITHLLILVPLLLAGAPREESSPKSQEPAVVNPGPPPSDAIVLFAGKDVGAWRTQDGRPIKWKVENGYLEVNGTGNVFTQKEFRDLQLHLEWATPAEVKGEGQARGNSGVYLQGRYEIQILDSFESKTYFNGQAGSLYGHAAPLVNACRRPGEWQSYDIVFHPPKKKAGGVEPGSVTVLQNGVLVQDHTLVPGEATTSAAFQGTTEKAPLMLQDHGNPVRYRNIWVREL